MTSLAALTAVLGADDVLTAARQLIDAEIRVQGIRVSGEPHGADRGNFHFAQQDAERAGEALATAARAAAETYARKETPCLRK